MGWRKTAVQATMAKCGLYAGNFKCNTKEVPIRITIYIIENVYLFIHHI
jgi:hypothetical protein